MAWRTNEASYFAVCPALQLRKWPEGPVLTKTRDTGGFSAPEAAGLSVLGTCFGEGKGEFAWSFPASPAGLSLWWPCLGPLWKVALQDTQAWVVSHVLRDLELLPPLPCPLPFKLFWSSLCGLEALLPDYGAGQGGAPCVCLGLGAAQASPGAWFPPGLPIFSRLLPAALCLHLFRSQHLREFRM